MFIYICKFYSLNLSLKFIDWLIDWLIDFPKYASGLELIIASVSVKKVWSCNIVRLAFPIVFLIPTNLS